jgi:[protein-PII] uridylyltransferase
VIEVTTQDRPGLLFAISSALFDLGLGIVVAKINTEGARVADVFYVSERDGSKVAPGPRTAEVEARLLASVGGAPDGDAAQRGLGETQSEPPSPGQSVVTP